MADVPAAASAPPEAPLGWEWKADSQRWVETSGKPPFRTVPDDTKPTLRDPVSISCLPTLLHSGFATSILLSLILQFYIHLHSLAGGN